MLGDVRKHPHKALLLKNAGTRTECYKKKIFMWKNIACLVDKNLLVLVTKSYSTV